MAKKYRLLVNTRFGNKDEIVTEQHLKDHNADMDDLTGRKLIESVSEAEAAKTGGTATGPGYPRGQATDEANKENVERRITEETLSRGTPLSPQEKDELAAQVTKDSGRPLRAGPGTSPGTKDVDKAEKAQEKSDADAQKAQRPQERGR